MKSTAAALLFATLLIAAPSLAFADAARETLERAVEALGAEDYRAGLALLAESEALRDDPRIAYYRGYALEKLGECAAAKRSYAAAARDLRGSAKLRELAETTRGGVGERCVEARPRGSGRTGWKILGWTTLILGGATLAVVPIQVGAARSAAEVAQPYFRERYGCDVDFRRVGGSQCDAEGLVADPAYKAYDEQVRKSQRITVSIASLGVGLLGIGAVTLLTVGLSRPSVDISFLNGRAHFGIGWTGTY